VARPPVLFLDEPTTGLDPRSSLAFWDTIESLVSGGTTVMLTTQYLDEADRLADGIAVIDHGVVIAEGTSDELKSSVGGDRLEIRLDDAAGTDAAVAALTRLADERPTVEDDVVRVGLRHRDSTIAEAVRLLDEAGVGIDDISVRRPTLDDVFFELTGHTTEAEDDEERAA
jgi:ABC-2 type transport system ATP-binding protein